MGALAALTGLTALAIGQTSMTPQQREEEALQLAIGEANGAPVELIHGLERYLAKYPKTERRIEVERSIFKAAVETRDDSRVVEYGERILVHQPEELPILDRVTAALLQWSTTNPEKAARALTYSRRFESVVKRVETEEKVDRRDAARRKDDVERGLSRSMLFQARALGVMGKYDEAVVLARKSFERYPSENPAHEVGRWLAKAGRHAEAAEYFAYGLMIPDPRATDTDRTDDRKGLNESWSKAHGESTTGLGDVILNAYDRTVALVAERNRKLNEIDPNREVTNPYLYTVSKLDGGSLKFSDLKGKVIVLDFWATWCGPCRAQYPLYEEVRKRFVNRKDVVFLAISADEDPSLVKPFLEQNRWQKDVYFDDGLARLMTVASIPATVVFDKQGQIVSRLNGYLPDRFVEMLSERIQFALGGEKTAK